MGISIISLDKSSNMGSAPAALEGAGHGICSISCRQEQFSSLAEMENLCRPSAILSAPSLRVDLENLAIGIGIQNFPEGLAVSLPLRGSGVSTWRAFWYGQLSGMVEPVAGLLGAVSVVLAEPLLPYALAFAAGAMVYVVVDDIIPEAQVSGNGKLASWTSIFGFIVMMSLDVGLG
ncbi:Zinc transporter ZIP11 [Bagarius yarrelli]|uniref:Zinc transporter ZIP11 n=1 Tax=Bagarius yarrelli TaxID=175774 RepID=A0A556TIB7_BAGYA|nr:Zinc transporter ZIP11 [Bagarius yarrelli]